MEIKIEDMSFGYVPEKPILKNINLTMNESNLTCVLGPNGVGKSTLMYCINKLQKPTGGRITVDGKDVAEIPLREMAKLFSFVPHSQDDTFSMSVMDTVLMGRHPHSGFSISKKDLLIAAENIRLMGVEEFAERGFDELSAGQHQRVMIARGLTQEPKVLMLDEPTANLDIKYQMLVMKLLKDIARVKNILVLVICHDLNVTAMYADRIILLSNGGVYADGTPAEVLTKENVKNVYGMDCEVTELQGRPHISLRDGSYLDSHIEEITAAVEEEIKNLGLQL